MRQARFDPIVKVQMLDVYQRRAPRNAASRGEALVESRARRQRSKAARILVTRKLLRASARPLFDQGGRRTTRRSCRQSSGRRATRKKARWSRHRPKILQAQSALGGVSPRARTFCACGDRRLQRRIAVWKGAKRNAPGRGLRHARSAARFLARQAPNARGDFTRRRDKADAQAGHTVTFGNAVDEDGALNATRFARARAWSLSKVR